MTAEYIVGVATEEKYRRQGRMAHLMKQAIEMEHEQGIDWVFLCPEKSGGIRQSWIYSYLLAGRQPIMKLMKNGM